MVPGQTAEVDEFDEAAAEADEFSGYEATRDADVEDQREYRLIPKNTKCRLGIVGFDLNTKKKPYIFVKTQVVAPKEYADGSSNFGVRMSLNQVIGKNDDGTSKQGSGWTMTRSQLVWLLAAVRTAEGTPTTSADAASELLTPVYADFPSISGKDEALAFNQALTDRCNELMKDQQFDTSIGIDKERVVDGTKYDARQNFGTFVYKKSGGKN